MDRVNGILGTSRAFGDFIKNLKEDKDGMYLGIKAPVSPFPVVESIDIKNPLLNRHNIYLVLACDGLWDVYKNEEVVSYVLSNKKNIANICSRIIDDAIDIRKSKDNVTTMIVPIYQCEVHKVIYGYYLENNEKRIIDSCNIIHESLQDFLEFYPNKTFKIMERIRFKPY